MAFLERFGLLLASAIVYSAAHPTKRPNTSTVRIGVVTLTRSEDATPLHCAILRWSSIVFNAASSSRVKP